MIKTTTLQLISCLASSEEKAAVKPTASKAE